jgi:hypothetical protein
MGVNSQPQGGGHFDRPFHPQGQPGRPPYTGPSQPFQAPMHHTQGGGHFNGPFHPQGQPGRPHDMGPNQPVHHQDQPGPVQPPYQADDSSQDTE